MHPLDRLQDVRLGVRHGDLRRLPAVLQPVLTASDVRRADAHHPGDHVRDRERSAYQRLDGVADLHVFPIARRRAAHFLGSDLLVDGGDLLRRVARLGDRCVLADLLAFVALAANRRHDAFADQFLALVVVLEFAHLHHRAAGVRAGPLVERRHLLGGVNFVAVEQRAIVEPAVARMQAVHARQAFALAHVPAAPGHSVQQRWRCDLSAEARSSGMGAVDPERIGVADRPRDVSDAVAVDIADERLLDRMHLVQPAPHLRHGIVIDGAVGRLFNAHRLSPCGFKGGARRRSAAGDQKVLRLEDVTLEQPAHLLRLAPAKCGDDPAMKIE